MIRFENPEFFILLIFLVPLLYFLRAKKEFIAGVFSKEIYEKILHSNGGLSKRTRGFVLIASAVFIVISLARPVQDNGVIKVQTNMINMVVALDISKSMKATDIYPNRFEFEKNRFYTFLDDMKSARISVIGFSSRTFLVSPLTEDYYSLRFLVKNLNTNYISLKGTDILEALKSSDDLLKDSPQKVVLLFTDGGDDKDFSKEIEYANAHDINVYIYNIGTKKGGIIKDDSGNVVLVALNENIKKLALETGGAYINSTLDKNDIKLLSDAIKSKHKAKNKEQNEIRDVKELFHYPLIVAILLFFVGVFSLLRRHV